MYTIQELKQILTDSGIEFKTSSKTELLLLALDNGVIKREELYQPKVSKLTTSDDNADGEVPEKRKVGRPRKYPPKEVDPNKEINPKHNHLRTSRNRPCRVQLTNVETGEVTSYESIYKASPATQHGYGFFYRNKGKVVDGIKYELIYKVEEQSEHQSE